MLVTLESIKGFWNMYYCSVKLCFQLEELRFLEQLMLNNSRK